MSTMARQRLITFYQEKGIYDDNGREIPAEPGDVFFCKDGDGHGIKNEGTEDLTFVALILKK